MPTVPTVKDLDLLFLMQLKQDPLIYFSKLHDQYGDVFYKPFKGLKRYYFRDPQCIEYILSTNQHNYRKHSHFIETLQPFIGEDNVLTTNNMSEWRQQRELMNSAFEGAVFFDTYAKVVTNKCKKMLDVWESDELWCFSKQGNGYTTLDILKDTIF